MNDTTPNMEKQQASMIATLSATERLKMASSMFDSGRALLRIGLKRQNESIGEAQMRAQIFLRLYGEDYSGPEKKRILTSLSSRG